MPHYYENALSVGQCDFAPFHALFFMCMLLYTCKNVEIVYFEMFSIKIISGEGIIGGREAAPHSRPYMASIQVPEGENMKHECGGFVIADQWVMTAVHCMPTG